eukprot:CAMPEP_0172451580 /NCGR_PEP_ID=MMETSP1065-20121228/9570_1 /TAXON_ID=265537 /ORGANISM="Amphiprora paludosa, Strain CCMP125" /LENGTH=423 /DNA_ID=CAMNT_0013203543 /DNA_START=44 /DNA_END=1315 /DNA_ORIENTATION=+
MGAAPPLMAGPRHPDRPVKSISSLTSPSISHRNPQKSSLTSLDNTNNHWHNPQLTPLGLYYPLGPCQTKFARHELSLVLDTLRQVFFTLSLHVKYHNSPISADCTSLDQVTFQVLILSAPRHHQDGEDDDTCILEVSRREGDGYTFHLYSHQIMTAMAQRHHQSDSHGEALVTTKPIVRASWNMDMVQHADRVPLHNRTNSSNNNGEEALEMAWNMLSSERYDARKLALESLLHMTDPNKSGWSTAQTMATSLLNPNGPIQERLSQAMLEYASMETIPDEVESQPRMDPFGRMEPPSWMETKSVASMERTANTELGYLSLVTFSQVLRLAARTPTTWSDVSTFLDTCTVDLVGILLHKVNDVMERPHDAYYAIQCLAALNDCVPSLRPRIKGAHVVEEAQLVGESSHLALATVTGKLLVSLQV